MRARSSLVLLLGQLRLAVDGVLKPLERRLEVLDARLEHLHTMLPTSLGPPSLCTSGPAGAGRSHAPTLLALPPGSSALRCAAGVECDHEAGPLGRSAATSVVAARHRRRSHRVRLPVSRQRQRDRRRRRQPLGGRVVRLLRAHRLAATARQPRRPADDAHRVRLPLRGRPLRRRLVGGLHAEPVGGELVDAPVRRPRPRLPERPALLAHRLGDRRGLHLRRGGAAARVAVLPPLPAGQGERLPHQPRTRTSRT